MGVAGFALRARKVGAVLIAAAVAACGSLGVAGITPGMTESQVRERAGAPTEQRALPGGGAAWYYINGPQGWTTYRVQFAQDGRVTRVAQVLGEDNFRKQIKPLYTTREELLLEFGRPAGVARFPRRGEEVWTYRYMESASEMLNDVHVDESTGVVTGMNMVRDPAYSTGGRN
jgi:hypothetical protein